MTASSGHRERILLAVVGLAPQIVTETLFALIVGQPHPFVPTRLHLVTTGEGEARIRLQLLDPEEGALPAFARDYAPALLEVVERTRMDVLHDGKGRILDDITQPEEIMAAADQILDVVRQLTAGDDSALCASIAGGRKSMGFLLGYAMSLYGRPQDRLTHVLVNPPFQNHPGFFYPPRRERILFVPPDNEPISTKAARVLLTDIPFLRLRENLPAWLLQARSSFSDTIADLQGRLAPPRLVLRVPCREIECGGRNLPVPPVDFAFAWWLARHSLAHGDEARGLSWRDACPEEFLSLYRRVAAEGHLRRVRGAFLDGVEKEWFEQRVSRFNKLVKDHLGALARYCAIITIGSRPRTRYGFARELQIAIEDDASGEEP